MASSAIRSSLALGLCLALLAGCGDDTDTNPSSTTSASTAAGTTSSGMGGAGGGGGAGGAGGAGGGGGALDLETVLDELRADRDATLNKYAASESGWPLALADGHLFVTADLSQTVVAGDHDAWAGTPMTEDSGFRWVVLDVPANDHYKFVAAADYKADPWSRSFNYDEFGEISIVAPTTARLDRFFGVGDAALEPRTLQIWVPEGAATHVLYVHDGQNLFNPDSNWGGWRLQETVPPGMLLVGINNTAARFEEYTHVQDDIGGGDLVGGEGDAYADFLLNTIRPMVDARYGEPPVLGVMGSSLGGLISLHIADRSPGVYHFAASLSGTLGWGSIGVMNETMIERYADHGHQSTVLYVDSGGDGACVDNDGDGIEDDGPGADNYCENIQLQNVLLGVGYTEGVDLHSWWEPDATHDEAAWAARVFRPFDIFAAL